MRKNFSNTDNYVDNYDRYFLFPSEECKNFEAAKRQERFNKIIKCYSGNDVLMIYSEDELYQSKNAVPENYLGCIFSLLGIDYVNGEKINFKNTSFSTPLELIVDMIKVPSSSGILSLHSSSSGRMHIYMFEQVNLTENTIKKYTVSCEDPANAYLRVMQRAKRGKNLIMPLKLTGMEYMSPGNIRLSGKIIEERLF